MAKKRTRASVAATIIPEMVAIPPEPVGVSQLASLACGAACPEGAFESIYSHLSKTLGDLEKLAFALKAENFTSELAMFSAPLVARSIFEAGLTALIGRFDPLRILIVRESQLAEDYAFTKKNDVAINWQSDFQNDGSKNVQPGQESKLKTETMSRSLLGKNYERTLWWEAVERLTDAARFAPHSEWLLEVTRSQPKEFIPRIRTQIQSVYSNCSKGIHQEFVIRKGEYSSRDNLKLQVGQAMELTAKLALVFNCSPHVLYPIDAETAIGHIISLDRRWAE